jgi:hypothetical protein
MHAYAARRSTVRLYSRPKRVPIRISSAVARRIRGTIGWISVELGLRYAQRPQVVDPILPATVADLTLLKIPRSQDRHRVVVYPAALATPRAFALAHSRQAPLPLCVESRIRHGLSLLQDLVLVCGFVEAGTASRSIDRPLWYALRSLTDLLTRPADVQLRFRHL